MRSSTVFVYRDKLFLPSESFIQRAYAGFSNSDIIYVGHLKAEAPENISILNFHEYYRNISLEKFLFHTTGYLSSSLIKILKQKKADLIHAHFGKSGAYALPLSKALNLPLIVTYHGADATKKSHTEYNFLRTYNRRRHSLFKTARRLLPVSNFIRDRLLEQGAPPEKTITHYNGVDPDSFFPVEKENRAVFAGRMVEKKGIDLLVDALLLLKEKGFTDLDQWHFSFLGEGRLFESAYQKLQNAQIKVDFPGWVSLKTVKDLLGSAKLVLIPSRRAENGDCEGLPMIALEGMMSGAAIIASDHAGLPEAILHGKTGLLFTEGDSKALQRRLEELLSTPEKAERFGKEGRKRALEEFNLAIQSQKLEMLLRGSIK